METNLNPSDMQRLAMRMDIGVESKTPIVCFNNILTEIVNYGMFDMHYALELGIVVRGRMKRYVQNFASEVRPGEVWLNGMWEPHGYGIEEIPCEVFVFTIWPPLLSDMHFSEAPRLNFMSPFITEPKMRPQISGDQLAKVIELAEKLREVIKQEISPLNAVHLRLSLMELLLLLLGNQGQAILEARTSPSAHDSIAPALEKIFRSTCLVTNEQAARLCNMSRDKFIRQFRSLMGVSFSKFALRYRLGQATSQLINSNLPLKSIAHDWGFTDESHLHRLFVRHYNCTPQQYKHRVNVTL